MMKKVPIIIGVEHGGATMALAMPTILAISTTNNQLQFEHNLSHFMTLSWHSLLKKLTQLADIFRQELCWFSVAIAP